MQIEIWSDVVCPWCYLGKRRFERALGAFEHRDEVTVRYRAFELDPAAARDVTTPTVDMLAGKYGMTAAQAEETQRQMEQRARQEGLEFRMSELRSGNTRDAHRLLHLAAESGRQPELVERLHRAYFTEQRSVFEPASLADVAVEAGLERAAVTALLAGDRFDDEVEQDEALARSFGATGVPFFVIDRRYGVSGAQPVELFEQALAQAWAERQVA